MNDIKALVLDLDELSGEEFIEAHIKYLRSLLRDSKSAPLGSSLYFSFDFDGTNHYLGKAFVLDDNDEECQLRMATYHDAMIDHDDSESNRRGRSSETRSKLQKARAEIAKSQGMKGLTVLLPHRLCMLSAEDLYSGLKQFMTATVMFS